MPRFLIHMSVAEQPSRLECVMEIQVASYSDLMNMSNILQFANGKWGKQGKSVVSGRLESGVA